MDPFGTLETLSEIGIAITGFAGIVAALDPRARSDWSEFDRVNLRTLLYWSVAMVFLAYVPWVLHGLGDWLSHPWRASHAVFAAYHSRVFYRAAKEISTVPDQIKSRLTLTLTGIGFFVLGLEIVAALGFADAVAPALYVIAVLWFLFLAVTRFVLLVMEALEMGAERGVETDAE